MDDGEQIFIQKAQWSPTGNGLVFVYKNDLYYKIQGNRHSRVVRITDTGSSTVFNGIPDWLYQGKRTVFVDVYINIIRIPKSFLIVTVIFTNCFHT